MATKKQAVFPKYDKVLGQMGENIKRTRKRRKLTMVQVAERVDIARSTLHLIESGKPSVAMGACFNVLRVLGYKTIS